MLTIPESDWQPFESLPVGISYVVGQKEQGGQTGYLHWQVMAIFSDKVGLPAVKRLFGQSVHAELSRSDAAEKYVCKEDTRVSGSEFQLGSRPLKRNSKKDWDSIWASAKSGDMEAVPSSVRVQSYRTLRAIAADYQEPVGMERTCFVFWGATGTGKSRSAWEAAGLGAYPKDPRTKFWCGYRGQASVVLDEFRGGIDIGHMLRWLDRYPVIVEVKGSSVCLTATQFWITSNIHPREWYPDLDVATLDALMRRLQVTHFPENI